MILRASHPKCSFIMILSIGILLSHTACFSFNVSDKALPDYKNRDGFILDYAVGDRFEMLKPMFLTRPTGEGLSLSEPGLGSPSLDQYAKKPKQYDYVIKVVPSGTKIKLVAIKDATNCTLTFVQLEGFNEWVWVGLGEDTKIGVQHHLRYDREYFKKVRHC